MSRGVAGGGLVRGALRGASLAQVRYVSPVRAGSARDLVADVYAAVEREFGMLAPPFALHSPAPEVLAACWSVVRETLVVPGVVARATKEAVAAAVSVSNDCPYCASVHSAALRDLLPGPHAAAIAADRIETIADLEIRAVAAWAREFAIRDQGAPFPARFPAESAPELVGVAVAFHYINRMVNVFLPDVPLPPAVPGGLAGLVGRVLARLMRSAARRVREPGASLGLLPAAPVPEDLWWAAGNPHIAAAYARAGAVLESAGRASVPAAVRELVLSELAAWDGRPKGISRAWVEAPVSALPAGDRVAGRLALLTAFASYQVDQGLVEEFRSTRPAQSADADLVRLASWASMTTARRIGTRTRLHDDSRDLTA